MGRAKYITNPAALHDLALFQSALQIDSVLVDVAAQDFETLARGEPHSWTSVYQQLARADLDPTVPLTTIDESCRHSLVEFFFTRPPRVAFFHLPAPWDQYYGFHQASRHAEISGTVFLNAFFLSTYAAFLSKPAHCAVHVPKLLELFMAKLHHECCRAFVFKNFTSLEPNFVTPERFDALSHRFANGSSGSRGHSGRWGETVAVGGYLGAKNQTAYDFDLVLLAQDPITNVTAEYDVSNGAAVAHYEAFPAAPPFVVAELALYEGSQGMAIDDPPPMPQHHGSSPALRRHQSAPPQVPDSPDTPSPPSRSTSTFFENGAVLVADAPARDGLRIHTESRATNGPLTALLGAATAPIVPFVRVPCFALH